jgi:hypothetical protein
MFARRDYIFQFLLFSTLGFIFGLTYIHNSLWIPASFASNIATFQVGMPHKTRILIPLILYHLFPHDSIDTFWFRVIFSGVAALACFYMFKKYWDRLTDIPANTNVLALVIFAIMLAHYSLNRWDQVFYIYDISCIFLSMLAVVLLTSERKSVIVLGGIAIVIFSFAKETIVSALLQSFGYWAYVWWRERRRGINSINYTALIVLIIAGFFIVLFRIIVTYVLGGSGSDYASLLYENGVFRIYANCLHVIESPGALQSVFLFGCGLVVWLPLYWTRLSTVTKWLIVASIPPFVILIFVDNFTELRCYSELLPLMACAFGQTLLRPFQRVDARD